MHWLIVGLLILIFLALTGGGQIARRLMSFLWCIALLLFVAVASGDPIFVFKGYAVALVGIALVIAALIICLRSPDCGVVNGPSDKQ